MKRIWFAVAFIVIAAAACTFEQYYVSDFCEEISRYTDSAIVCLSSNDKSGYNENVKSILNCWNKKNDLLFAISGHTLLDELSSKINTIENREEHIYDVKALINAYSENSKIKLSNIL